MRALLVDDSEEVRTTTAWALSREGFQTAVVRLGREVPGIINKFEPDVLILDLSQSEADGRKVAAILRENFPALPIILASDGDGHDGPLPTRTESVQKPYSIDTLVEAIIRLIYSPSSDL